MITCQTLTSIVNTMFEIQSLNRKEVVQSSYDNAVLIFNRIIKSCQAPNEVVLTEITSEGEHIIRQLAIIDRRGNIAEY